MTSEEQAGEEHRAAMLLIVTDDGLLMHHRDDKPGIPNPGCWAGFGGAVERGETVTEALRREVREETGLEIRDPVFLTEAVDYEGDGRLVSLFYVSGDFTPGDIALTEGAGVGIQRPEDLPDLKITPFVRRAIESHLLPVIAGNNRGLRLRPLRPGDETEFRRAHEIMTEEGFSFGLAFDPAASWETYLKTLEDHRKGINLPGGWVPGTLLAAEVNQTIVGRVSIRHRLNDFLEREAGHIGYGVLPGHRGRGYATEILRQGLSIARSLGIDRVLVVCDDDNTASATVIERCGGQLDSVIIDSEGTPARRYWIG